MQKESKSAKSGPGPSRLSLNEPSMQKLQKKKAAKSGPGPFEAVSKGALDAEIATIGQISARAF